MVFTLWMILVPWLGCIHAMHHIGWGTLIQMHVASGSNSHCTCSAYWRTADWVQYAKHEFQLVSTNLVLHFRLLLGLNFTLEWIRLCRDVLVMEMIFQYIFFRYRKMATLTKGWNWPRKQLKPQVPHMLKQNITKGTMKWEKFLFTKQFTPLSTYWAQYHTQPLTCDSGPCPWHMHVSGCN
jgi:hypothetical protein